MTMLRRLAAVLALTACGGAAARSGGAAEYPPKAAFRAYVAAELHVAPGEIHGGSNSEAEARRDREHTRGNALPYVMWRGDDYNNAIRGWVTLDGTVITPTQNLGRLLAEEGVWDHPPRRRPDELASAIIADLLWSYGPDVEDALGDIPPPRLELAPDGSGTLRFVLNDHRPTAPYGGGGGGGAPADAFWEYAIAFTADHQATLSRRPFAPRVTPEPPRSGSVR